MLASLALQHYTSSLIPGLEKKVSCLCNGEPIRVQKFSSESEEKLVCIMTNFHNDSLFCYGEEKSTGNSLYKTKNRRLECLLIVLIFTTAVSENDQLL